MMSFLQVTLHVQIRSLINPGSVWRVIWVPDQNENRRFRLENLISKAHSFHPCKEVEHLLNLRCDHADACRMTSMLKFLRLTG